jgi:hypothetical protein
MSGASRSEAFTSLKYRSIHSNNSEVKLVAKKPVKKEEKKAPAAKKK